MHRVFQICLMALIALSIGSTQVFGVQRGFLCADQAQPQEMSATHCHRSGDADGRFVPCQNREPAPDCPVGEMGQHEVLKVQPEAIKLADAVSVAAPAFVPVATPADVATFEYLPGLMVDAPCGELLPRYQEAPGSHRHTSVFVAECVVLLV